jgi:primary-amine oxidase
MQYTDINSVIKQASLLVILSMGAYSGPAATTELHPLDGLTDNEYLAVVDILRDAGKTNDASRFALINLDEPDKQAVLNWQPGDKADRRALVAVWHKRALYEGIVDLRQRKLVSWELIENAQPALMDSEWVLSQIIVRSDDAWKAAISKRGIENFKDVFCFPVFPGNFDRAMDSTNDRLGVVSCYDTGSENTLWGRPVEGLVAIVNYDERTLVELIDTGVVPIPTGGPPVDKDQPNRLPASGPAEQRFSINNNWVEWDKWRFHLRIDPRVGPVLSQVSINDGNERRSVMYQGSISELFVPYMDPTENWYFRTYLDVGEYGIGASGVPLRKGMDCPADAELVNVSFMSDSGKLQTKEGIVCVFERITGDASWSHYEITQTGAELRRHSELVVRFVVWLGNYDYILDWIFTETGSLKGRVGATGIVQVRGVDTQSMADKLAAHDTAYGRLIRPGLVAVNHDHYFNFRLDLDVDGTSNNLSIDRLKRVELDADDIGTPRKQIWQVFPEIAATESAAKLNVNPAKPAMWRVTNPASTNGVGNPVSYHLSPGKTAMTLMGDEEIAHRRAAFTAYNLWATPYVREEKYSAGDYPNRHPGGAGLPAWTAANRAITDTDIVLWYTVGMHHVVRAEDWPIMPTLQHEFELRPFDFFDQNPTTTTADK